MMIEPQVWAAAIGGHDRWRSLPPAVVVSLVSQTIDLIETLPPEKVGWGFLSPRQYSFR